MRVWPNFYISLLYMALHSSVIHALAFVEVNLDNSDLRSALQVRNKIHAFINNRLKFPHHLHPAERFYWFL